MIETLVVVGNVIQLQPCSLYAHHVPILNSHHICPASWWQAAGKPIASPMAALCSNCHAATHTAIDGTIEGRDLGLLPPRCIALARQAFTIASANGLTPALTL